MIGTRHDEAPRTTARAARVIAWLVAGTVLALVALSYLNPHLMLDLADKLWACF